MSTVMAPSEWLDTKIFIGKLISKRKFQEARELLNLSHQIAPTSVVSDWIGGALFVLDVLHPEPREVRE